MPPRPYGMHAKLHWEQSTCKVKPAGAMYTNWLEKRLYQGVFYKINLFNKGISEEMLATYYGRDLLTQNQIAEIQNEKLREFLKYCNDNSPYYHKQIQEHSVNLRAEDMFAELRKIPSISKMEITRNLESIFSREYVGRKGLIAKFTGGSTGTPLEIWGNHDDYRENNVIIARQRRWVNWVGGMKTMTLFGGSVDLPSSLRRITKRVLINDTILNIMDRSNTDFSSIVAVIRKKTPHALIAYFSILKELSQVCECEKRPLSGINVAIACAEPIEERARRHAEQWLNAPIYFQYGTRETGTFAQECRAQNGYHYAQDIIFCEVLDDDDNPCEFGNLVITWFANKVVPLVRYKIGDSASIVTEACACGLPYHRIDRIEGRMASMIITPDNRRITSLIFPHLLKDYDWIIEYQAEQTAKDHIVIRIRTNRKSSISDALEDIKKKFNELLGRDICLEFKINEDFLKVPTGKHLYFVSHLNSIPGCTE